LLVCGGNVKSDGSMSFSERSAKLGSIGELLGNQILPFIVKLAKQ